MPEVATFNPGSVRDFGSSFTGVAVAADALNRRIDTSNRYPRKLVIPSFESVETPIDAIIFLLPRMRGCVADQRYAQVFDLDG
jgi:hypothetical protein